MNMIKTVGDLVKVMSAYDQDARIEFSLDNQTYPNAINNDTAVFQLHDADTGANILHIALLSK
jgi:hypothetical protein